MVLALPGILLPCRHEPLDRETGQPLPMPQTLNKYSYSYLVPINALAMKLEVLMYAVCCSAVSAKMQLLSCSGQTLSSGYLVKSAGMGGVTKDPMGFLWIYQKTKYIKLMYIIMLRLQYKFLYNNMTSVCIFIGC